MYYQVQLPNKVDQVYTFVQLLNIGNLVTNQTKISNKEDDLIADLLAIDVRREKLGKNTTEYQVFTGTRFWNRCQVKIFDNSLDELDYRKPRNQET